MEKVEERVLAYKLAKEIDAKYLDEVSGGGMCAHPSGRGTGQIGGMDGEIDMTVDW